MGKSRHPTKRTRAWHQEQGHDRHIYRCFEYDVWLRIQRVKRQRRDQAAAARADRADELK